MAAAFDFDGDVAALSADFFAASQLTPADMKAAAAAGFALIVNTRPDDEEPDQPASVELAAAAARAGLTYIHIPVDHEGVRPRHAAALKRALNAEPGGKTLGFCLSGKRAALVWAHVEAMTGRPVACVLAAAERADFHFAHHLESLNAAYGAYRLAASRRANPGAELKLCA
ncbi:MAG: TIGR01244 family sulfur transferase [Parvularculaceae bacterium]